METSSVDIRELNERIQKESGWSCEKSNSHENCPGIVKGKLT